MAQTLHYTGELTVLTCWCGIKHAVPEDLRAYQLRQHDAGREVIGIYCPLGHSHIPSGTPAWKQVQREKEEAEALAARRLAALDQERAAREAAERSARAHKGAATRARNRAKAALCPVPGCKRRIKQMAEHLETKHPGYVPEETP